MNAYLQGTLVLGTKSSSSRVREVVGSDGTDAERAVQALATLKLLEQGQSAAVDATKKESGWASRGLRNFAVVIGAVAVIAGAVVAIDHIVS